MRLEFLPGSNRSAASRNTVNIARGSVAALATGSAAPRGHAHPAIPRCNALSTIFTQSSSRTHGTQLHTHVTGHAFTCMHGLGSMELMICARQPRLGPRLPVHNLAKLKLTFGSNLTNGHVADCSGFPKLPTLIISASPATQDSEAAMSQQLQNVSSSFGASRSGCRPWSIVINNVCNFCVERPAIHRRRVCETSGR